MEPCSEKPCLLFQVVLAPFGQALEVSLSGTQKILKVRIRQEVLEHR